MVIGKANKNLSLTEDEIIDIVKNGTPPKLIDGKKIVVLTPDATRTAPLPMMINIIKDVIGKRSKKLDFMIALGSHKPLSDKEILNLYGITESQKETLYRDNLFFNHHWDSADTFIKIGKIERKEIEEATDGLFKEEIDIIINKYIYNYDLIIILGPVFPHEIAGFSGGNKYLFPGISGGEFLHLSHWLGAVSTCWNTIGKKYTPVRKIIDKAAGYIDVKTHCIAMVVKEDNKLAGLYVGSPLEAWSKASDLSSHIHIVYKKKPFKLVIGKAPDIYDEIWTAGKVMYKLEPVVENSGKLIIYGPHIKEISYTWGRYLEKIGYHVRDYFLSQMDKYKDIPKCVLAHSTHVKGLGTYNNGIEKPRIDVILATSISEKMCKSINLGYINPNELRIEDYQNHEDEGVFFVNRAGETLYRLESEKNEN